MKNYLAALILFLAWNVCAGQNYRSRQDGNWNTATTWQVFVGGTWQNLESAGAGIYQNQIPSSTSDQINIINGDIVSIPSGYSVTIDETIIDAGGRISVQSTGTLDIAAAASALIVNGSLLANNGSAITGTNGSNVVFNSNATYYHRFTTTEGTIPRSTWAVDSEIEIQGYTTFTTATATGNWDQSFGNFIWNCTSQTSIVNLSGLLTTVTGNLQVSSTNTGTLQFSSSQNATINIGGDLEVEGASKIIVATTSSLGATVNVGGDFNFSPTNSSTSTLSTTGHATINISGDFVMSASGSTLYLCNSTGNTGTGTLNIQGDFNLIAGTLREGINDSKNPNGNINFVTSGGGVTHSFQNSGTIANRINYRLVSANDTLRVESESELVGHLGSAYIQQGGVLIVESTAIDGAIQSGSGPGSGNIRTATRTFATGSQIIYQGSATAQSIGNGQPSGTTVVIDNATGVRVNSATTSSITIEDLIIEEGFLFVRNDDLIVTGTTTLNAGYIQITSVVGARIFTTTDLVLNGGDMFVTGSTNTVSVTIGGDIDVINGDISVTNAASVATFNANGDINLTGGGITFNSGTANLNITLQGDFTGTGNFTFIDANNNVNILGSGNFTRDFPVAAPVSLENLTVNRTGGTITFPQQLTITNNLTITGGTAAMDAALTVVGDLNIGSGGILSFNDQTVTLLNEFNNTLTGGTLSSNQNSLLSLTGSGIVGVLAFSPTGNTLGTLVLNRATSGVLVSLNSSLNISGSLTLSDGNFNNTSGLSFTSGAVLFNSSNSTFTGAAPLGGPYDVVYTGTSLSTASEILGNVGTLTSMVSGTVTLASDLTAADSLNIVSGVFAGGANAISTGVFYNDATFSAPTDTLTVSDNFINDGIFTANASVVKFSGNSTISGTSSTIFHSIAVSNTGTLVPSAILVLTGDFTNNGIYNSSATDIIRFSGTARQDIEGTGTTFSNVEITNAVSPVSVAIESAVNLQGVLTLSNGAQFDADGLTDTGILTVVSLDDQPVSTGGSIATIPATAAVLGSVTVQRTMEAKGQMVNRYVSSPVTGALVSQMTTDFASAGMKWYNETVKGVASNGYKTIGPSGTMVSGRGYLVTPNSSSENILWDVRGPLTSGSNQGSVNFNVTHTVSSPPQLNADGWNLVGNPYPCGISWANDAGWQRDNIGTTIYVYDMGGAAPNYKLYNAADDTGDLPSGIIALGQSFWVYAEPAGTSVPGAAVLIVNEQAKTGSNGGTFYRKKMSSSKQLMVSLTRADGAEDKTFLKLNVSATEKFDRDFDAIKLHNETLNISLLDDDNHEMAMHTLASISEDIVIPIAIQAAEEGEYTMSFKNSDTFLDGERFYITDLYEGVSMPISESFTHSFHLVGGGLTIDDRFKLSRRPLEDINDSDHSVNLYPNPTSRELNISVKEANDSYVMIVDQLGKIVLKENVFKHAVLNIESLPRGLYTLRVVSKNKVVLKKFVKQ
jgi:hypothetical protein